MVDRGGWPARARGRGQGGQVVPLVAVALLLAGVLGLGLVHLAAGASRRAAAQAAADAAALAGAAGGRAAATEVAAANQARLVRYREEGDDVVVAVERRGARASARARWEPDDGPAGGRPTAARGG
ncbi:hypothetical protein KSP35_15720 [Aquihabitans sp. G128]|uniref:hypothetical protein n=1 Tax=Aquihabitans sp. G128 TaxID=2849779 RepID=UPI001C22139D|nr:hypothetical protein [Aquihabitans sp. G128]QXC59818.1 hypothetical protein KSP35_15720 [Aquihabitans sp. G128]